MPHIHALLARSAFPLSFVIHLRLFLVRKMCLVVADRLFAHPYVHVVVPTLLDAFVSRVLGVEVRVGKRKREMQREGIKADDTEDDSEFRIEKEVAEGFRYRFR